MAVFNFPIQQPNHPAQAVRAAREMQRRWRGRRTELLEGLGIGEDDLSIGIGISSGNINFGEFGQSHRDLTAIGTVVDLPLNFHPAAIKASAIVLCCRTLDRQRLDFSAFITAAGWPRQRD